jgi:hypothetical protein
MNHKNNVTTEPPQGGTPTYVNLLKRKTSNGEDIVPVAMKLVEEGHAQHHVYDAVYEIGTITTANRFEDALCYFLAMNLNE